MEDARSPRGIGPVDIVLRVIERLEDKVDRSAIAVAQAHDEIKTDIAHVRTELSGLNARVRGIETNLERRYDFGKWLAALLVSAAAVVHQWIVTIQGHHR
jgi:hypothetical protein